jgi:hypothetical protein
MVQRLKLTIWDFDGGNDSAPDYSNCSTVSLDGIPKAELCLPMVIRFARPNRPSHPPVLPTYLGWMRYLLVHKRPQYPQTRTKRQQPTEANDSMGDAGVVPPLTSPREEGNHTFSIGNKYLTRILAFVWLGNESCARKMRARPRLNQRLCLKNRGSQAHWLAVQYYQSPPLLPSTGEPTFKPYRTLQIAQHVLSSASKSTTH